MKNLKTQLLLLLAATACAAVMTAQTAMGLHQERANVEKMSITTQMFLDELEQSNGNFETPDLRMNWPGQSQLLTPMGRLYATPDTIDGEVYISAFVKVATNDVIAQLQAMGVRVETVFDNGLLTTMLPVEGINKIAALDGVKRIEVSQVMTMATDRARPAINADDVLAFSEEAAALGLPHGYDGTGVIVGVIDRGIDFDHIAFKDKDGNCRIKRAYVFNGVEEDYYGTGDLPRDGVTNTDHGTHVSAIAGGSSVIINDDVATVTDDHASATYGGVAPGAELFLCGLK